MPVAAYVVCGLFPITCFVTRVRWPWSRKETETKGVLHNSAKKLQGTHTTESTSWHHYLQNPHVSVAVRWRLLAMFS